jgi:aspartate/methionine/tyrosine aminotransferase
MMQISRRSARTDPFIVMDVLAAANERQAAGESILHLELGQPAARAPRQVIAAARAALERAALGYTEALGLPELRAAIAGHYCARYGVAVPPQRIVATVGSSGGFLLAFLALFDAGARVAMAAPAYPAYRNILRALDLEPVLLPAGAESGFQPTPELIAAAAEAAPLHGLILASPANPTGALLDRAALDALAATCRVRDIRLISDEIYHGLTYGRPAETALAVDAEAVVVNSFSKYFAMTGWRIGWMVVPQALLRPVERLAQNLFISAPTLSQIAAIAAFDAEEELEANRAVYAANRDLLLEELPRAGFGPLSPAEGAFYVYADIRRLSNDSTIFCQEMLRHAGVAAVPGVDFDPERGHAYVRFSFAGPSAELREAARRLKAWLG